MQETEWQLAGIESLQCQVQHYGRILTHGEEHHRIFKFSGYFANNMDAFRLKLLEVGELVICSHYQWLTRCEDRPGLIGAQIIHGGAPSPKSEVTVNNPGISGIFADARTVQEVLIPDLFETIVLGEMALLVGTGFIRVIPRRQNGVTGFLRECVPGQGLLGLGAV